jgi:hypothetical protein
MSHFYSHRFAQPVDAPLATPATRGVFALRAGRAMTLQPKQASVLRITEGAAWVTLPSVSGDHFLRAGDALHVPAGDHLVMEAWQTAPTHALHFDWDVAPIQIAAPRGIALRGRWLALRSHSPRAGAVLRQPLADLRAAAFLGAGALARLATGVVVLGFGFAIDLLAAHARFDWATGRLGLRADLTATSARARKAQSSANNAQGRMASGDSMASSVAL